jgi:T5orf172 domain
MGRSGYAPTVALGQARRFRSILKKKHLSEGTRRALEHRLAVLEARASDPAARKVEDEQAVEATSVAEEHAVPGVYVYALPHYVRHPYDEESGRTLLKVGRADRSVIVRFRQQTRTTALPEDPVLLRVYPTAEQDSSRFERKFHALLEAADHDRSKARTGGTEWFLTSLRFLDEIATTLELETRDITDLGDVLD